MELMHNQTFRILQDSSHCLYKEGLYRVIVRDNVCGKTIAVQIDQPATPAESRGGRKKIAKTKSLRKKAPPPLVGSLQWMDNDELQRMEDALLLRAVEVEREPVYYKPFKTDVQRARHSLRVAAMSGFLDLAHLTESILVIGGLGELVKDAMERHGVSRTYVYKQWSILCRLGISEVSLRPRLDRCGAPGVQRPCDPGGRKKAGRKTKTQRVAKTFGIDLAPEQPGMSTLWRAQVIAADRRIETPVKPKMPERFTQILDSQFVKKYQCKNGQMVPIDPAKGEYPNYQQVKRVLEVDIPLLQRLRESTTSGHFSRALRGLVARNWKGVAGPGHTWAIDSTVGDIYLRSSVNRAWIVGRPIVYIIVDVWSTAIVGFYVCLTGPNWNTAKVSLFNSVAPPELMGELWGCEFIQTLHPAPTMCFRLMCDRGEYLSKAASHTAIKLIPCMSYAPPYRPDLKGLVEVLHRIMKDSQFLFTPGAMDHRRAEYDLRKSHPEESVMTVREYTQLLHVIFSEYNLTANRSRRVDAHMLAAGVFPSPAGLWSWGHAMGVGLQRSMPHADLTTWLLESDIARIGRSSVAFAANDYHCEEMREEEWTTHARNFGGWDIPINYHPSSVSRIWTPNTIQNGLLNLHISDQSKASPELTFDEYADSIAFGQMGRANVGHQKAMLRLQALRHKDEIIRNAACLTLEAEAKAKGALPTMTEARLVELAASASVSAPSSEMRVTETLRDEVLTAHHDMLMALLASANGEEVSHG